MSDYNNQNGGYQPDPNNQDNGAYNPQQNPQYNPQFEPQYNSQQNYQQNPQYNTQQNPRYGYNNQPMKFCQSCGSQISAAAVVCPNCGCQVGNFAAPQQVAQPIIINNNNNNNNNINTGMVQGKAINKWVAFILCFFLGVIGIHKFYEGKIGMGILYLFTGGLVGIGVLIDLICILCKPNPYYV